MFDNVLIQPRDAREASDVFYRQRLGDVLLTYENEVVLTNEVGGTPIHTKVAAFNAANAEMVILCDHEMIMFRFSHHAYAIFHAERLITACWRVHSLLSGSCLGHPLLQVYGPDKSLPYVVPSPNVRIECPLALVDKVLENRPASAREAANAFANFLFTSPAQVC